MLGGFGELFSLVFGRIHVVAHFIGGEPKLGFEAQIAADVPILLLRYSTLPFAWRAPDSAIMDTELI